MAIDLKTVKHISKLARISVDEEKANKLAGDLNSIFEFIEKLNELNTENVEPLTSVANTTLRFREDEVQSQNILSTHIDGQSFLRKSNVEIGENVPGIDGFILGNGITGHDETSEVFNESWEIITQVGCGIPEDPLFNEDALTQCPDSNNNGLLDNEELGTWVDDNLGKQGVLTESQCDYIGGFFYDNDQDGVGYCGDGSYTSGDYKDNFQTVDDINGDGLSDYPDFEVKNGKAEIRLDYDPNKDTNISFQSGYSWSKLQQITGIGRFIADGYEYSYYQLRGRYKNMFAQVYLNQGDTGETRGYDLGNVIRDVSENVAFQFQHNFDLPKTNTNVVWGIDMFTTTSKTNGSVLNDGPNGYDNDGDQWFLSADDIDNDFDSNDFVDWNQNGYADILYLLNNKNVYFYGSYKLGHDYQFKKFKLNYKKRTKERF